MEIQWPLVIFSLFAGCGGGLLAFLAYGEIKGIGRSARFTGALIALAVIFVGGFASLLHLGNPSNIMAAAANIGSLSGISLELISVGLSLIAGAVYAVGIKREAKPFALKAMAAIAGTLGVVLAFVTGNGYVMISQPNWNSIALPLCYLASGLTMGGAVYAALLFFAKNKQKAADEGFTGVTLIVIVLAAIQAVIFLAYAAITGFVADVAAFWICAVIIGCAGTILCAFFTRKKAEVVGAGAVCAVIGGLGIRCAMWIMGTGWISLFTTIATRGVLGL